MKRTVRFFVNTGLVIVSIYVTFHALAVVDLMVGWLTPQRDWPGPAGLLFIPGTEDNYDMWDFKSTDRINSLGFRDREFGLQKTSKIRAIVIGDSVVFGSGVNIEDTWCKLLEANLRKQGIDIEVLNLGKPAAGPRDYAAIAECAVPRLKPDLVIIGMNPAEDLQQLGNAFSFDPENSLKEHFPNMLYLVQYAKYSRSGANHSAPSKRTAEDTRKWYAATAQEIAGKMTPQDRALFDKLEAPIKEAYFQGRVNPWMIGQTSDSSDYFMSTLTLKDLRTPIRKTKWCLQRVKKVADRNGAHVVVLSVPDSFFVNNEAHRNGLRLGFHLVPEMLTTNAPEEALVEACKRAGITSLYSVTDEYRKHPDITGLWYEYDRHMTRAGNVMYADLITPIIASEVGHMGTQPPAPTVASPQR